ncbi:MAG: hypothetical protein Q8Q33_05005 [Chlamydiota bacterium]|nr:hypothetical protein [Chlamydiota bacterium]
MQTALYDAVKVGVVFGPGHPLLRPVWFIWKLRRYPIIEVTYTWKVPKGRSILLYFSVRVPEGDMYQLCYDSYHLSWSLEAVATEE